LQILFDFYLTTTKVHSVRIKPRTLERKNMKDLTEVKRELEIRLDTVNAIINGEDGMRKSNGSSPSTTAQRPRRQMAPETRAKIAQAARERWARVKKENKAKSVAKK